METPKNRTYFEMEGIEPKNEHNSVLVAQNIYYKLFLELE